MKPLGLQTALAVAAIVALSGCGDDQRMDTSRNSPKQDTPDTAITTAVPADAAREIEQPLVVESLRGPLTGEDSSVIGEVQSVEGDRLTVETTEVLSAGLQARQNPDRCPNIAAGYSFTVVNTTDRFENDLAAGDAALFIGQMCDDYRNGELWIPQNGPNGRRLLDDDQLDLGGGDTISLDEARNIAGSFWADVPAVDSPLDVSASLDGSRLAVTVRGSSDARIGITLCGPGEVRWTSPSQDYFGPCSLQLTDADGGKTPDNLQDGRLDVVLEVPAVVERPFDVVVFGQKADGQFQVLGIQGVD